MRRGRRLPRLLVADSGGGVEEQDKTGNSEPRCLPSLLVVARKTVAVGDVGMADCYPGERHFRDSTPSLGDLIRRQTSGATETPPFRRLVHVGPTSQYYAAIIR